MYQLCLGPSPSVGGIRFPSGRLRSLRQVTSYYGYEGQGSVRYLTGGTLGSAEYGQVTDTYTYDAFGIQIGSTGGTPNNYLYAGEQWDPDLGMYYLRARYYHPDLGRFWTMDTYEGNESVPLSLHKYLYCENNPINGVDLTGKYISSVSLGQRVHNFLGTEFENRVPVPNEMRWSNKSVRRIIRERFPKQNSPSVLSTASLRRPDLASPKASVIFSPVKRKSSKCP